MNPADTAQETGEQHAPLPPTVLSPFQEKPDKPQPGSAHEQPPEAANGPQPGLRALLADLSPYYDVRPLKELGPLAAEVARNNGPALLRALAAAGRGILSGLLCLARGLRLLLVLLAAWLSGHIGERGSAPVRLAIAAFLAYALATAPAQHPAAPYAMGAAFLALLIAAGTGAIPDPTGKRKAKKAGEKSKKTAEDKSQKGEKTPQKAGEPEGEKKDSSSHEKDTAAGKANETEKEKDTPRVGLFKRLTSRARSAEEPPASKIPNESPNNSDSKAGKTTPETPTESPLTALLRREIGTDNGVHLADLRPAMRATLPGLATATDEELRQALITAGWDPSQKFRARGRAGRAGVHRKQLPPLPSPGVTPGTAESHSPTPGDRPRPANSPQAESSGEKTGERSKSGYHFVPDPERGPTAWKIRHDGS